ncbi:ArsR family transcriptional regulator [Fictibacillus macauensis ZFHKF-1]|uniref:ArsR family transcriptional regulator n=1 Tax=Fictibacillus macauensis ZFHKF-1 TaxID=1196324 RepID=I8UGR0_9BACL|nr:autorepressor SdpR family transcription factor [Fictibacillus macauensis]EIT86085.1 ArsR family transcriptional regulator [Fictibacillus macauensis ZFHKF-1]
MNGVFKALADPTRVKILDLLKKQSLTAGEIYEHFSMKKPSISHHLNILSGAQLIYAEKKGQFVHYHINLTAIQDVMRWAMKFKHEGGEDDA